LALEKNLNNSKNVLSIPSRTYVDKIEAGNRVKLKAFVKEWKSEIGKHICAKIVLLIFLRISEKAIISQTTQPIQFWRPYSLSSL
jgi:hypothetical protein